MKNKILVLALVAVLVLGTAIGGTVAWLSDKTGDVVNTFTTSNITIKLTETEVEEYKMIPGHTIDKDPTVEVLENSEPCWLFVKLEESANFDTFMTYGIADGWTLLEGEGIPTNVYYRGPVNDEAKFSVLDGDEVTVLGAVTSDQMTALTTETLPTLTVTAYASQYSKNGTDSFTAIEAWGNLSK